jgi:hypothetical protein
LQPGVSVVEPFRADGFNRPRFDVTFRIEGPQYPYKVWIPCYVRDKKVDWYYFRLDDALKFIALIHEKGIMDQIAKPSRYDPSIHLTISGSRNGYSGKDDRTLNIDARMYYEIGTGHIRNR